MAKRHDCHLFYIIGRLEKVKPIKTIGLNFIGGVWGGILIVSTAPYFVSVVGLEGYGLIGFWQLLLFVTAIFDFGLGASLMREFARYRGSNAPSKNYCGLLSTLELVYIAAAVIVGGLFFLFANWLSVNWLNLTFIASSDAAFLLKLMAGSIVFQFITTLYLNGLAGAQEYVAMNTYQILGNTLKYVGGAIILLIGWGLWGFFVFQAIAAILVCLLTRRRLLLSVADKQPVFLKAAQFRYIRQISSYSSGMFFTALCGLLLANVDRIVLSKYVTAEDFGRYTLAFTAAGLLQMVVLAFYRAYFPKFAELGAAGNRVELKQAYYQGCRYVGAFIVPTAVAACVFAPHFFRVWTSNQDDSVTLTFRLLVIGVSCSGLMWLPAALQQSVGWTRLHFSLMVLALALGAPLLFLGIHYYGIIGATALALVHGAIEISLGLWLMNRVMFPGENWRWYASVIVSPLIASLPIALASAAMLPVEIERLGLIAWLGLTGMAMLLISVMVNVRLDNGSFKV